MHDHITIAYNSKRTLVWSSFLFFQKME